MAIATVQNLIPALSKYSTYPLTLLKTHHRVASLLRCRQHQGQPLAPVKVRDSEVGLTDDADIADPLSGSARYARQSSGEFGDCRRALSLTLTDANIRMFPRVKPSS